MPRARSHRGASGSVSVLAGDGEHSLDDERPHERDAKRRGDVAQQQPEADSEHAMQCREQGHREDRSAYGRVTPVQRQVVCGQRHRGRRGPECLRRQPDHDAGERDRDQLGRPRRGSAVAHRGRL